MRTPLLAALTVVLGCTPKVVEWEEAKKAQGAGPKELVLTLRGASASFVSPVDKAPTPNAPNECPGSMRLAHGKQNAIHAIWWEVQPDSTGRLYSARSTDGGLNWLPQVIVDSTDIRRIGCSRPAPAIAVDTVTGYIHTVFPLENASGAGVFFAHSMEGGALFHSPVAIVYGEVPTTADIAADADRVVVAYEDPNMREQSPGRIALAISVTSGHIFEHRVAVNTSTAAVAAPKVAIAGDRVAVSWIESPRAIAGEHYRVIRTGQLKVGKPTTVQAEQAKEVSHPAGHTGAVPAQP